MTPSTSVQFLWLQARKTADAELSAAREELRDAKRERCAAQSQAETQVM